MYTPFSQCPECNTPLNQLTPSLDTDAVPARPGDIALCEHCLSVLVVGNDFTPRKITQKQFRELPPQLYGQIERARTIIRSAKKSK